MSPQALINGESMSVPEQKPIVVYKANGTTTNFPITFDLHDTEQIFVVVNNEVPEVGAYTVLNKEVVFTVAPKNGDEITVSRMTALERETNYKSFNNSFRPQSLNWDFNKIWHVLQESNLIDAHILARLKQEFEWRRTHDANIVENINNETEQRRALDQRIRNEITQELQDRQAADDQIRNEIEQEVSARRALDLNYDMLAQARDMQVFAALKQYLDTIVASATPNIFGGVTAGIVFALDKKSIQTHLEEILDQLANDRIDIESKSDAIYVQNELNKKASITYVDSVVNAASEGKKFFKTQSDLLNAVGEFEGQVAEALDTHKVYFWEASEWIDVGQSAVEKSNAFTLERITKELALTDNLNTLEAGNYFLSTSNLNALVDASNFVELGYPIDTVKSGAVKINVVRKNNFSYQTLEFPRQGRILTRQGAVGSTFYDWVDVADAAVTKAQFLINQEITKKFGTVTAGTSLNTFINAGAWGISGGIVAADSKNAELGYPAVLTASSAVLTVAQTASNYAIQELTHGTKKYKRILNRANGSVFEDWSIVGGDTITDYAKKGVVANLKDLNTYIDEGVFACTSAVMRSGLEAGNLNYPTFFEAVGGGLLIVGKSGVYPYQIFIATRQKKIAVRQGESATSYLPWVNMLDIVPVVKKTFLAFGSSSFYYMSAKIKTMIESFNATYISDAIGGQILETMQAHQGSNPVSITFNDGVTALNSVASTVTVTQKDEIGSLSAKGSFVVTLSNGLKGTLNLDANTFTASNATEIYNVGSLSFDVDFGYSDYAQSAYHIVNIGKNNITMGSYTAQQVIDETNKMIDFIKNKGNQNFIVGGHFVDRGMTAAKKQVVLDVNAALKAKYGLKYFDMQDYLMLAQIWTDLNITPTQDDLDKQAAGELAVSLSRDDKHLSADVDTLIVERLKQKLQSLSYL